ncbi:hypothetical protein ASPWEDRAFT_42890 [Aspergillus wentii DTO 134E9]|uniref:succinate-semialdehyde dehydrogenase [NAD(P)(+)] n=1 Tax=Aspergillus wentii DTO 134E9 TaxID=1073089 RepID=A0A1L9RD53_ASPWE|nr:uncharacterized protein ASPWEDRAFT_42890 [Aspergillus wentii DTO 134E9]OJJ32856.1 hypothetical protein ASPWEDRAFT_42890 [Aspergillus wentii DTO 134E9]
MTLHDPTLLIGKNYIDGKWQSSLSNATFDVTDPSTNKPITSCPESTPQDLELAIQAAAKAFTTWKQTTGRERSRLLRRFHDLVIANKEDIATLISWENGKASADAKGEVLFAASFLEWYAEEAVRIYGDVVPHSNGSRVQVIKQPVGVCGMITPWNYPAGMITRKIGPALAAGCTVVVKSDGNTPLTANALVVLAERAGIPNGVINIVTALENTPLLGLKMCQSPIIRKLSFTGSTRVGKILAEQSGSLLKKLSLELGGNASFIIFDDADIDNAVAGLIASKFKGSGQTCVSANRVYVQSDIYDVFLEKLVRKVRDFKVGPGLDAQSTMGPLIGPNAVVKAVEHIQDAVQKGAEIVHGGQSRGGNFIEPTILKNANDTMKITTEETFAPVVALFRFSTEEEALKRANDCDVGLASYIFTTNIDRANRVSENLETGMVAINTGVISDAAAPFGGVKHSGLGREGGVYGIQEYLDLKTIVTVKANL